MSTAILTAPYPSKWIISKGEDLTWFIGGSLLGFIALAALAGGFPVLVAVLLWNLIIDGPHVFATASRTYFDKTARQRLGWRLWMIVPLIMMGPIAYALGFGGFFVFAVITWAQYHIAKQHFGFVMLYKRKTNERTDINLDRRFLLASLMLPWLIFSLALMGVSHLPGIRIFVLILLAAYLTFVLFFLARQTQKAVQGETLNLPKLLLFALVIPLQWVAFMYSIDHPQGILIAGIATNIGHSLQYQRLTWFHNRNRYKDQSRSTIGWASIVNSHVSIYFLTAFVLNLVLYRGLRSLVSSEALVTAVVGINMAHYYIDSLIWRTRSDKDLAAALRL